MYIIEDEIRKRNIPCWYELSFDFVNPAILIRIHKDFIKTHVDLPQFINSLVAGLINSFGLGRFELSFKRNFGFDNSLIFDGVKNEFLQLRTTILASGYQFTQNSVYSCSASLMILFRFLNYFEEKSKSKLSQLMIINTILDKGSDGGSIGGVFSQKIYFWMKKFSKKKIHIKEAERAMWLTRKKLLETNEPFRRRDFQAVIYQNGGFHADIPGNSCGIDPSLTHGIEDGQGYEFCPHNVDFATQQIVLLAGLATLYDKARKGGA